MTEIHQDITYYIVDTRHLPLQKQDNCGNTTSQSSSSGFNNFIRSILPAPPDIRRVVVKQPTALQLPDWAQVDVPEPPPEFGVGNVLKQQQGKPMVGAGSGRLDINSGNTMIIGTYISAVFPKHNRHWLVQAQGNAMFESTMEKIKQLEVVVDRRYIFIELGSNQIRMADKEKVFQWILQLTVVIRERNKESRIYYVGVLPRPVENEEARPKIIMFN